MQTENSLLPASDKRVSIRLNDHDNEEKSDAQAVTIKQHENMIKLPRPTGQNGDKGPDTEVFSWFEITLKEADVPAQTFTCSIEIHLFWQDWNLPNENPRYKENDFGVHEDYVPIKMHEIFENKVTESITAGPDFEYHESTGVVYMFLVVECTFAERMELNRFPLDRQFLNIEFNAIIESENEGEGDWKWILKYPSWMPKELEDDEFKMTKGGKIKTFAVKMLSSITEYELKSPWVDFSVKEPPLIIELRVNRLPKFYYGNIVLPNFLIVLGCFGAFTVDRTDVADRLGITVTLMLAAVAFRFVVSEHLPKVSYLTLMDYYLLTGFVCLILLIFENAFVGSKLFKNPKTADAVDYFAFITFAVLWLLVHIVVLFTGMNKDFLRIPWPEMHEIDNMKDPEDQFVFADGENDYSDEPVNIYKDYKDDKDYNDDNEQKELNNDIVLEMMEMDDKKRTKEVYKRAMDYQKKHKIKQIRKRTLSQYSKPQEKNQTETQTENQTDIVYNKTDDNEKN